jgi:carbon storage regulator
MLVLARKVGQEVQIGDNVIVQVLEIKGKWVTLGFSAPRDVEIWRAEVEFQEEPENKDAA